MERHDDRPRGVRRVATALGLLPLSLCVLSAGVALGMPTKGKGKEPAGSPAGPNFLLDDWMFDLREETRSHSEGRANSGAVRNAQELPLDGRSWRVIASARGRRTNFGVAPLIDLLKRTADALAEAHPGTLVEIGNIGLAPGGRIVQSKSHQAGRDVDVAFFGKDRKGRPARLNRFISFDGRGRGEAGYLLDAERTWDYVALLLQSEDPVVQWIFISGPIRELLLEHARERKADPPLIRRASEALKQPSDSTSHDDHMHVRIHCSDWDRLHGCEDYGPVRGNVARHAHLLRERLETLSRRVRKGLPRERLLAMEQLARLQPVEPTPALLEELLCDPDPGFRERALMLLRRNAPGRIPEAVVEAIRCAPDTAAATFLFEAVSDHRRPSVYKAAATIVSSACGQAEQRKLCLLALATLAHSGDLSHAPLLAAWLDSSDRPVRDGALKSLRALVASSEPAFVADAIRPPGKVSGKGGKGSKSAGKSSKSAVKGSKPRTLAAAWQDYAARIKGRHWGDVVLENLQAAGYKLKPPLLAAANARELLRALRSGAPASTAAQIALFQVLSLPAPRHLGDPEAVRVLSAHVKPPLAKKSADTPKVAGKTAVREEGKDEAESTPDSASESASESELKSPGGSGEVAPPTTGGEKAPPSLPQLPM